MRWASNAGEVVRAFLYAAVTALLIVALAYLLGRSSSEARDQAYFEIHDHRIAAACVNATITDALNVLLEDAGHSPVPTPDVDPLDCDNLEELLPTESTRP